MISLEKNEIPTEPQLSLGLKTSYFGALKIKLQRSLRVLSVSTVSIVFKNLLFWVNTGILLSVFYLYRINEEKVQIGKGVLFTSGYHSGLQEYIQESVSSMLSFQKFLYLVIAIYIILLLGSMLVVSRGKGGLVTYIQAFFTIILIAIAKLLIYPLILM